MQLSAPVSIILITLKSNHSFRALEENDNDMSSWERESSRVFEKYARYAEVMMLYFGQNNIIIYQRFFTMIYIAFNYFPAIIYHIYMYFIKKYTQNCL